MLFFLFFSIFFSSKDSHAAHAVLKTYVSAPPREQKVLSLLEHKNEYGRKDIDKDYQGPLMGIELEAHNLKVKHDPRNITGLKFYTHNELAWILEEDTVDKTLEGYRNNLECLSVGGFKKTGINQVAYEMGTVLGMIVEDCQNNKGSTRLTSLDVEVPLRAYTRDPFVTKKKDESIFQISLIELGKDFQETFKSIEARPQITYQVGIEKIEELFQRVASSFKHKVMRAFLESMNLLKPQTTATNPEAKQKIIRGLLRKNREENGAESMLQATPPTSLQSSTASNQMDLIINSQSRKDLLGKIASVIPNLRGKLRGFTLLFAFYCDRLFTADPPAGEPGLKSRVTVMSRIPFSHIYWKILSEEERSEWKKLFDPIMQEYGHILLRGYKYENQQGAYSEVQQIEALKMEKEKYNLPDDYRPEELIQNIRLLMWYNSIVEKHGAEIKPDILSSPPGMSAGGIEDSMGAMRLSIANPLPLFEIRGCGIKNIENSVKMVYQESEWFFDSLMK